MTQTCQLFDYGIQTEKSDIRVHVCPVVERVYVYPTRSGLAVIGEGKYAVVEGFQAGCSAATSEGYLVPPDAIPNCVELTLRKCAWDTLAFDADDTTTAKGDKAVRLVKSMLRYGLLPLPTESQVISNKDMQVAGTDILIHANQIRRNDIRVQVKCDFRGGSKGRGGTGHLFLQIKERNPFGLH